jgi:DNA (cytosine-5)-methyltransferase 1
MLIHDVEAERNYTVVDLFAGCGGLTLGFNESGRFRPLAAVEVDVSAAATYAMNFGEEHVYPGDIADWLRGSLPSADVVIGGPPCQGYSALGTRNPRDPRNAMWRRYVDTLERVRPLVFVLENVPQFLDSGQFQSLRRETRPKGRLSSYELEHFVVNSADYGVGQARKRAVVIGRPKGVRKFGSPEPDLSQTRLMDVLLGIDPVVDRVALSESWVSVFGVELPGPYKTVELHVTRRPTDLSLERYSFVPPGGNRHHLPDRLSTPGWRRHKSGAGDVMGRLSWGKPSVTIRTEFFKPEKGRYLHPDEPRPITHFEAARIQGFPDQYLWCGTKVDIARQIGNAVPPVLARRLAAHIAARLDELTS